ncbi:hypothetical protein ACVWXQ_003156 [Bradyrhizobium sp. S3.14.4]
MRRERHDRAARRLDFRQASSDRGGARRAGRALQGFGQRIVAAGIEHEDAQILGLLQIVHDVVDTYEALEVCFIRQHSIDRHQIVDAVVLHRMAAVVEHRDVGAAGGAREADGQVLHVGLAQVDTLEHLETAALERGCDVFGVMRRVGKLRCRDISAVADHQRDPRVRRCGTKAQSKAQPEGEEGQEKMTQNSRRSTHECLPGKYRKICPRLAHAASVSMPSLWPGQIWRP